MVSNSLSRRISICGRMPTKKPTEEHLEPEEENEEQEEGGLIRTCHLCGKAQCGQRRGRVRCAYCKRVFCLQQLYKKFGIRTTVDDRNFKCPRCLGICCCVTDCKKGPPHVHCKVFKVRQNKRKNRELAALENAAQEAKSFVQPVRPIIQPAEVPPMHPAPCITRIHSIPSFTSLTALPSFQPLPTPDLSIKLEPDVPHASSYIPISPSAPSSYLPLPLPDPQPPLYADPYLSTSYGTPLELSRGSTLRNSFDWQFNTAIGSRSSISKPSTTPRRSLPTPFPSCPAKRPAMSRFPRENTTNSREEREVAQTSLLNPRKPRVCRSASLVLRGTKRVFAGTSRVAAIGIAPRCAAAAVESGEKRFAAQDG